MRHPLLLLALFLLPGYWACQSQPVEPIKLSGPAQGTTYHITYYGETAAPWQAAVDSLLDRVNQSLSTYHEGSLINQFNQADSLVTADPLFVEMVTRSREIARTSEGAFDPSVMPLVRAWGFGPDNALVPKVDNLDSLRQLVGMDKILERPGPEGTLVFTKARPGVQLDFNAIAQGYTVDLLARLLESRGVTGYLVELGGEVRTRGRNPQGKAWTLGVEKPIDIAGISELATLIELGDQGAATSGNYRKFYEQGGVRYSHTIDPATGAPVQHTLLSTTVLAADGTTADAYATAFMVMGLAKAQAFIAAHPELKLEAYFISSAAPGHYIFDATPGMQAQLRAVGE